MAVVTELHFITVEEINYKQFETTVVLQLPYKHLISQSHNVDVATKDS
jgi:hypothetical protein